MARLNPAQHRLWMRHVERAIETLREGDRLLRGAVGDAVERMVKQLQAEAARVDQEASTAVRFPIAQLPIRLVPYVEDPFVAALSFNLYCQRTGVSHTQAQKSWEGGAAAAAARNLVFLPAVYHDLWSEGHLDKTRLVSVANRNLTPKAALEVAQMVRSRRKEDLDGLLLRLPAGSVQLTRRGPGEAMEAAAKNGWLDRLATVEIPGELVLEAGAGVVEPALPAPGEAALPEDPAAPPAPESTGRRPDETPFEQAARALRAGLAGARLAPEVSEALQHSPDPMVLVERFLTGHRRSGNPDPSELTKTLFFAHAGVMQRLVADDKLLLRHFRPVKTQKRGQLFYRLLEVIEEAISEKAEVPEGQKVEGLGESEAMRAVRRVIVDLNKDPNRYLVVPDDWLGEVTRRHLYFGSRTRKEGAAYKWYRKIGAGYFLGAHKTDDELLERAARRAMKGVAASSPAADADMDDEGVDDDAT